MITTGYLTKDHIDIGTLFVSGTSSITTGYLTKDNIDIGTLFSLKSAIVVSITGTGTYTTTIISGYTIHTFKSGTNTLNITNANNKTIYYLCVAGGGAGGGGQGGGGGAGGYLDGSFNIVSTLTTTITVGAGQAGRTVHGATVASGSNSSISSPAITSFGGGRGAWANGWGAPYNVAQSGGSGGGGNNTTKVPAAGVAGQGFIGGTGSCAGGGGADGTTLANTMYGGNGKICTLNGISLLYNGLYWAGGGGGGRSVTTNKDGGLGGGGGGAGYSAGYHGIGGTGGFNLGGNGTTSGTTYYGGAGGVNTGSGGGAGDTAGGSDSGAGGSGIVVVAYLT
jgi:hypothetical protein